MTIIMEVSLFSDTVEELEVKLLDLHRYFEQRGIPGKANKVHLTFDKPKGVNCPLCGELV